MKPRGNRQKVTPDDMLDGLGFDQEVIAAGMSRKWAAKEMMAAYKLAKKNKDPKAMQSLLAYINACRGDAPAPPKQDFILQGALEIIIRDCVKDGG